MSEASLSGICSSCQRKVDTNLYHGSNSDKMELCKECYDQYAAKEMLQYWKDHIAEEERRANN